MHAPVSAFHPVADAMAGGAAEAAEADPVAAAVADEVEKSNTPFKRSGRKICLLYTSPSPRDS